MVRSPPFPPPDAPNPSPSADPLQSAREGLKSVRPKRFWREARAAEGEGGFFVALDGRPARTPGGRQLVAPSRAAAEAMAAEWNAAGDAVDPASMPLTRLVNTALDGVAANVEAVRADILAYAGSDLLCYRAAEPERLTRRQRDVWDPVLDWAAEALGARLRLAEGVMFIAQPPESLAALEAAVARIPAPHALAALHVATTLTGSAVLGLALAHRAMTPDEVWRAAHLDEDAQMEAWGADAEALTRRAARRRDFDAAATLLLT